MTDHKGLPVKGYKPQPEAAVAAVNEHKAMEERILRRLDWLRRDYPVDDLDLDYRWLAIAQTHFEEAFMALNRAVFCPERIALPEDEV